MRVVKTPLRGVLIIEPDIHCDKRGFFLETYRQNQYSDMGVALPFVQDNHSRSSKHVLRGLHYQLKHPQGKLVSVTRGEIFDVVADIALGSPTFGQVFTVVLNDREQKRLYVPPGYAHGFCVLSDEVDLHYKCTDYYTPGDEYGILWNDPALAIDWPYCDPIVSDKDARYLCLSDQPLECLPEYQEVTPIHVAEQALEAAE